MNTFDQSQKIKQLSQQNERLKQTGGSNRNSQGLRSSSIDFETKYKKALKQIYDVIQANKQLKQELDKLKSSRHKQQSTLGDIRKEEFYKVYDNVLKEKNQLSVVNQNNELQKQRLHTQVQSLQAQMNILKNQKLYLVQQKQALQANSTQNNNSNNKSEEYQQLLIKYKQKQSEYHRTIQNYQQHHIALSKQNKKNEQRIQQLQQKIMLNQKNWRNRFQAKDIQFKDIKSSVRHEYQDQINNLRKQINSLKLLNTELMTKLQTVQMDYSSKNQVSEYEIQMLNSIKELRIQMEPLKKQIISLQDMNNFEKQQAERQNTALQMKVYQLESDIERYSLLIKNQEDKMTKLNQTIKKREDNDFFVKKLEEQNKILGGRVIVLESKDVAIESRKQGSSKLEQKVLQFQTRIEMLLNEKQNIFNLKNVSIHQLVTLKAYIVQMDQKLKAAQNENQYAAKKYKSYKEKYLNSVKQIKNHQLLQNTLKSKILGYDKLVQKLQSQLQRNVNLSQMEIININTKTTTEVSQVQTIRKKYNSLKQKLVLQEKYNRQELQTIKLNYQTKIVDMTIKVDQINSLRDSISLYKEKNDELMAKLVQKQNQALQVRLNFGKQSTYKNDNDLIIQNQNRQIISSMQQTITKQQGTILKLQTEIRNQEDGFRKRIATLQRQFQETNSELNRVKLSSTTKVSWEKNSEQISSQNRKLKNKISELQNQIILIKGSTNQQNNRASYQLEFRLSSIEIEKNEISHKLQTQISFKRRLQKQVQQLLTKNNQLDAELTQLNMQSNRKQQQMKYQITQKQNMIQNLEEEIKRLKNKQRSNLQNSTLLNTSTMLQRQDHTMCENKLQRLQRDLQNIRTENQQLRGKLNSSSFNSFGVNSTFNYELQSLKSDKQQARLKIQRLQRQISNLKSTFSALEQQKYDLNKNANSLKSQLNSQRSKFQDEMFQKDRIITQLRSKLQHSQASTTSVMTNQNQLQNNISQRDRDIAILKSKLSNAQDVVVQLQNVLSRCNQQISNLRRNHQSICNQMEQTLQQKQKIISTFKFKLQSSQSSVNELNNQIQKYTQQLLLLKRNTQSSYNSYSQQMQETLQQKQRTIQTLRSKLLSQQNTVSQLNATINNYNQQILSLKRNNQSSYSSYAQQMEALLQEKQKTLAKYKQQINSLSFDLNQKNEEISLKDQSILRIHRQLSEYKDYEEEVERLRGSLNDREGMISKNRFELQGIEEQNQRIKKQSVYFKQQLQKLKFDMLQKDDQISSLQLQLSNTQIRLSNQIKNQYTDQISQIQNQVSRLKFQLQSMQNNYNQLQEDLNESQSRERKLQNQVAFVRTQISRYEEQISQLTERLSRRQSQFSQVNSEIINLRYLQEEVDEKNNQLNKLKSQTTQLRIANNQLQEEVEYKQNTIIRQTSEIKLIRQELIEREQFMNSKDTQMRNLNAQVFRNRSLLEDNELVINQKESNITRLTSDLNKIKEQYRELQEEIQEREHQWSNISYELNQAKSQINLIQDQIQGKDITIAKLSNQSAFLKQQITRLNEEIVQKNHQINRINQQVFLHKMELTNQSNQQSQNLSNQIFNLKRQLQSFKHNMEDLQAQNRRLRIQIDDSRIKFTEQSNLNIYSQEDLQSLKQQNNKLYRQIMELQLELSQRNSQIDLLNQKISKLQQLLDQVEEEHQYNNERLQKQIQGFIMNERQLHAQIQALQNVKNQSFNSQQSQNADQLKFGLKLYTEQTDRLQKIIKELTQQVQGLRLKLSSYTNQQDRISQNLVTMVMTFAQIQSLRERMKTKQVQINEVRKSLIAAVSSNDQINSQYRFKSSKVFKSQAQNQSKPFIFQQAQQANQGSIVKFKSQHGYHKIQAVKQMSEFEILPKQVNLQDQNRIQIQQRQKDMNELDQELNQLNELREEGGLVHSQVEEIKIGQGKLEQQNHNKQQQNITNEQQQNIVNQEQRNVTVQQEQVSSSIQNTITQQQQRNRMINITYQGSQVQPPNQPISYQRVSQSQYQGPQGVGNYVRVLPRSPVQPPIIMSGPVQSINPQRPILQQGGNRVVINNQMIPGNPIIGSFQAPPQNLRY